jgi:hypothetical protein
VVRLVNLTKIIPAFKTLATHKFVSLNIELVLLLRRLLANVSFSSLAISILYVHPISTTTAWKNTNFSCLYLFFLTIVAKYNRFKMKECVFPSTRTDQNGNINLRQ